MSYVLANNDKYRHVSYVNQTIPEHRSLHIVPILKFIISAYKAHIEMVNPIVFRALSENMQREPQDDPRYTNTFTLL